MNSKNLALIYIEKRAGLPFGGIGAVLKKRLLGAAPGVPKFLKKPLISKFRKFEPEDIVKVRKAAALGGSIAGGAALGDAQRRKTQLLDAQRRKTQLLDAQRRNTQLLDAQRRNTQLLDAQRRNTQLGG